MGFRFVFFDELSFKPFVSPKNNMGEKPSAKFTSNSEVEPPVPNIDAKKPEGCLYSMEVTKSVTSESKLFRRGGVEDTTLVSKVVKGFKETHLWRTPWLAPARVPYPGSSKVCYFRAVSRVVAKTRQTQTRLRLDSDQSGRGSGRQKQQQKAGAKQHSSTWPP